MLATALLAVALADPCTRPTTSSDLRNALSDAEKAFSAMDLGTFDDAWFRAQDALECLGELAHPLDAAAYHRLQALAAFVGEDDRATRESLRAVLSLQPEYHFPATLAPPPHPLIGLLDEVRGLEPSPTEPLPPPPEVTLYVDGSRAQAYPTQQPFILQGLRGTGDLAGTTYVPVGDPLPGWAVPGPADPPRQDHAASDALYMAAGTTLVVATVVFGYASGTRAKANDPDTPADRVETLKSRARTSTAVSVILLGSGTACLVLGAAVR